MQVMSGSWVVYESAKYVRKRQVSSGAILTCKAESFVKDSYLRKLGVESFSAGSKVKELKLCRFAVSS